VGGLTGLHPLAKKSMELMGDPKAHELMKIVACVGLAQNFAALRSLTTTGIQAGHMKLHLKNILSHFHATEDEIEKALVYFKDKVVSFSAVREYLHVLRTA
jgi:hydroxymethylglutaryl-CoA reductase